jgi:opacity protein-like surface antigen
MKKILTTSLLACALSVTSAFGAEPHWYAGVEYATGSGERTYDFDPLSYSVDVDSSAFIVKGGYMQEDFDKIELQWSSKTLENSNNSSDDDDVMELKVNFVVSMMMISYKEMVIPYWEAAIGYADSDLDGGQLATHLGLGVMFNPIEEVELTLGYRFTTNVGTTDDSDDRLYYDQHGDVVVGAAYRF